MLETGGKLWAFDIKLTNVPDSRDLGRLRETAEFIGADRAVLINRTDSPIPGRRTASLNVAATLEALLG